MINKLLIPVLLVSYILGAFSTATARPPEKIKIGVSLPLTGADAARGADMKSALNFANKRLAESNYEFVFEDDKCEEAAAKAAAEKFIKAGISYVLGYPCESALLAAAPLYDKNKVVVISSGASAPAVLELGENVFFTSPNQTQAMKVLFEHIAPSHRAVAALSEETDYARALLDAFMRANRAGGPRIVLSPFLPEVSDFRDVFSRLKVREPSALFVNSEHEKSVISVVRQARETKWEVPVFAAFHPASPSFVANLGKLADGVLFVDVPDIDSVLSEKGQYVWKRYQVEAGKPPNNPLDFVYAYEALNALHLAIQSGNVQGNLQKGKVEGLIGTWSFDDKRNIGGISHQIKIIVHGKVAALTPKKKPEKP